jgi:hypothetical protein
MRKTLSPVILNHQSDNINSKQLFISLPSFLVNRSKLTTPFCHSLLVLKLLQIFQQVSLDL